jgi:hypothetical protein
MSSGSARSEIRAIPAEPTRGEAAPNSELAANAACIRTEIEWFQAVLERRMRLHAGEQPPCDPLQFVPPPELPDEDTPGAPYADVVRELAMSPAERLVLILCYLPHIRPEVLDPFLIRNQALDRSFTEFGGLTGHSHGGFLPSGETAMFLLAGEEVEARLRYHDLFQPEHFLYRRNILQIHHGHQEEPPLSAALQLSPEYVERLTSGRSYRPPFSAEFPAQGLSTLYEWDDLVLDRRTLEDIQDIVTWVRYERMLLDEWGLQKRLKAGFRSLFYGPPGTGKTLTASLLGKMTGLPVYRIDLSKVVSKYIGETEKNLASLFDHAQNQDWVLFFDEADSLFGKRTESRNANDRAANQQISYLLQRIEDFPGVVLLATNQRGHLDEAFARRFQSMIHFPMPGPELRLRLWRDNFEDKPYPLAADVDLETLAREHELAGGSIVNVLRHACLKAVVRKPPEIRGHDLFQGIRRELHKEGRSLPAHYS